MTEKSKAAPKASVSKQPSAKLPQGASFEGSIQRLGEIVEALEGGELPLEESLKLFEEGVGLARQSQKVLDDAEQRVEQLLNVDDHGAPIVRALDSDSLD